MSVQKPEEKNSFYFDKSINIGNLLYTIVLIVGALLYLNTITSTLAVHTSEISTLKETQSNDKKDFSTDGSYTDTELAFALNHRFKKNGGWQELRDIQVGAILESTDGSTIQVIDIQARGMNDVVKITVDDAHTYSTSGLLSHNVKIQN